MKTIKKFVAKGLFLLGGVICLSRGHSALGAKVAMAYIITTLIKPKQAKLRHLALFHLCN